MLVSFFATKGPTVKLMSWADPSVVPTVGDAVLVPGLGCYKVVHRNFRGLSTVIILLDLPKSVASLANER